MFIATEFSRIMTYLAPGASRDTTKSGSESRKLLGCLGICDELMMDHAEFPLQNESCFEPDVTFVAKTASSSSNTP